MMSKRLFIRLLSLSLLLIGLLFSGQGLWIKAKAHLAYSLLDDAWDREVAGEHQAKPWRWADTWPVARLSLARLGIDQMVLAGASGRTLAFGAGHISGTVLPGELGNSVISGHRDSHFEFLKDVQRGDVFTTWLPDGTHSQYSVESMAVYDQADVSILQQTEDSRLTLVTCYPFASINPNTDQRYVVIARNIAQG